MAFGPLQADEFLGDLETFCVQSGCTAASIGFPDNEDRTSRREGLIIVGRHAALTIQGPYASIMRLIETLQTRSEKVWIDKLSIRTNARDPGLITCQLTITIYVNPEKENGGDENTAVHD